MSKIKDKYLETPKLNLGFEGVNSTEISVSNNSTAVLQDFDPGVSAHFKVVARVSIDATTDTYEVFNIEGMYAGGSNWVGVIDVYSSTNNYSGVSFTLNTSSGELSYTIPSIPGFVSGSIDYRIVTING